MNYTYYSIQFDENFGQYLNKELIINYLSKIKSLKQITHQTFANSEDFAWLSMSLVETYDGNFSTSNIENQLVTLISVVCDGDIEQKIYTDFLLHIAQILNWRLFVENDEKEWIEIK